MQAFWVLREWEGLRDQHGHRLYPVMCSGCNATKDVQKSYVNQSRCCNSCSRKSKRRGQSAALTVWRAHQRSAASRNIDNLLTKEEWFELTQQPCFYCDRVQTNTCRNANADDFEYNGVDRLDSRKPYSKPNCVPCCKICNYGKHDLSLQEYADHISNQFLVLQRRGVL